MCVCVGVMEGRSRVRDWWRWNILGGCGELVLVGVEKEFCFF